MNVMPSPLCSRFKFAIPWLLSIALLAGLQSSQAYAQTKIDATLITGESLQVSSLEINDGKLSYDGKSIDLNQVSMFDLGNPVAAVKPTHVVYLAGGGKLNATSVSFNGEQFVVACEFGELRFPSESIKGVLFQPAADLEKFNRALANRSSEQDIVIASRGDSQGAVQGLVETIDGERMKVLTKGKSRSISFSKLVAIVPADLKSSTPSGTLTSVNLANGSVIKGALTSASQGKLNLSLAGNANVSIPTNQISSLTMQSDRVVYLADLEPTDVEEGSLATVDFPWQTNTNVLGEPLRIRFPSARTSKTYVRGIGTHAASRLEFANENGFDRLAGIVGIDATTEGRGDCIVSIWGDGIKLWEKEISGKSDPHPIELDVSGMERIALVVRNGKNLDLGDHVNWANIRLMKTKN